MGFLEVLTIVFITLKITGTGDVATWSWLWVLSPLWIGYGIALVLWVLAALVGATRR